MKISGITKFTLIDFPEKVSCIIFTAGCNFRCGYCHNSEYVLPEKLKNISLIPEKAVFNFLEKRKGLLEGVSICGGEPTIHKDLPTFCKKVKDIGYSIKLDTNGQNPKMIKQLLDNKVIDYIAMDIKNPVGEFAKIVGTNVNEKHYLESIELIKNSNINHEFRTTVIKGIHNNEKIEKIAKYIRGAKNYNLQNYKSGDTLNPTFEGKSFSEQELIILKKLAQKYVNNVKIKS
ncbi:anaerobic ribonucleoside-triphosphate reductase activating protein [Candidatus Gracilibacteria bacterium]|nr:MAG: anaerobic ribonucleoside-triphosphate reductase activating protein [Candidatus Gracilibacteria bacterium]PIE85322.1 MAG: anaerobic ribonucleoside-triphosphate reductase activating protein [Candidatus Gracilibacteria bacterium]